MSQGRRTIRKLHKYCSFAVVLGVDVELPFGATVAEACPLLALAKPSHVEETTWKEASKAELDRIEKNHVHIDQVLQRMEKAEETWDRVKEELKLI